MDIATVRKNLNLTQAEFAQAVGTTQAYIGHLESGRRKPSLRLAARIEAKFSVFGLVAAVVADKTSDAA